MFWYWNKCSRVEQHRDELCTLHTHHLGGSCTKNMQNYEKMMLSEVKGTRSEYNQYVAVSFITVICTAAMTPCC